eukprot:3697043-Pleurochrysis_carterae.AAC.1
MTFGPILEAESIKAYNVNSSFAFLPVYLSWSAIFAEGCLSCAMHASAVDRVLRRRRSMRHHSFISLLASRNFAGTTSPSRIQTGATFDLTQLVLFHTARFSTLYKYENWNAKTIPTFYVGEQFECGKTACEMSPPHAGPISCNRASHAILLLEIRTTNLPFMSAFSFLFDMPSTVLCMVCARAVVPHISSFPPQAQGAAHGAGPYHSPAADFG